MTYRLSLFCRSGEKRGDAALDRLLDHLLATGEPLVGEWLGPFGDSVASLRLGTKGEGSDRATADLLTLEVHVGVSEIAESVIAASPNDEEGVWGCDLLVTITLSGDSPDWPLVNRIWTTAETLWGAVPWDEASGFEIASSTPRT